MGRPFAISLDGPVAQLRLTRPDKHNAFDEELVAGLTSAFTQLEADEAVRVVVLSGEGKSFCAGADAGWMRRQSTMPPAENLEDARRLAKLLRAAGTFPKPLVACVQGAAFGGGMGLACCADIVLASDTALFALSEVRLGLIPAVISPWVIRRIGLSACRRLTLTGERIGGAEALRWGLADLVVPPDELEARTQTQVQALLVGAPGAQAEAKALYLRLHPVDETHLELTAQAIASRRATAEAREGLSAFLEKRSPQWGGA
ncbi:MAG: enoyl-CoA hydratase-related protein [Planctomycetota bacterium]